MQQKITNKTLKSQLIQSVSRYCSSLAGIDVTHNFKKHLMVMYSFEVHHPRSYGNDYIYIIYVYFDVYKSNIVYAQCCVDCVSL